ncbi:hypothetical protein A5768_29470 [Mycolicibacterium fortuitum]|nr:hypothetical protein A5763_11700 [Mycolicibacterium fortuitum]OBG20004.1 hypothetical protein A5768_29470 [Mycolicibacterium fortuitum]
MFQSYCGLCRNRCGFVGQGRGDSSPSAMSRMIGSPSLVEGSADARLAAQAERGYAASGPSPTDVIAHQGNHVS